MEDDRQIDLFLECKDPVRQGTNGMGANPAVDPSDANRDGSKFGSYFAERAENAAIANKRRQRMNAPGGMTLDEAMGFAVMVLKRMCADSDMAGTVRAAELAAGQVSALTGGAGAGDGVARKHHARTGMREAGAR